VLKANLAKRDGVNVAIGDEAAAQAIVAAVEGSEYRVLAVTTKEKRRYPVPPFITSTLQQEAARKLRFSVKRTMGLAQRCTRHRTGREGSVGLISYMRTDSTRVADEACRKCAG